MPKIILWITEYIEILGYGFFSVKSFLLLVVYKNIYIYFFQSASSSVHIWYWWWWGISGGDNYSIMDLVIAVVAIGQDCDSLPVLLGCDWQVSLSTQSANVQRVWIWSIPGEPVWSWFPWYELRLSSDQLHEASVKFGKMFTCICNRKCLLRYIHIYF